MGVTELCKADYMQPSYKIVEQNEALQVSPHPEESGEVRRSDRKRRAIDKTMKMFLVALWMIEKRGGKKEVN